MLPDVCCAGFRVFRCAIDVTFWGFSLITPSHGSSITHTTEVVLVVLLVLVVVLILLVVLVLLLEPVVGKPLNVQTLAFCLLLLLVVVSISRAKAHLSWAKISNLSI
jgi:hypothetical protein